MWKAPYEGIILIRESAKGIAENYDRNKQVIAKTYVDNDEIDDSSLRITVNSLNDIKSTKEGVDVNKGTNYYFITDSGQEPEKTDIEWNINIE